MYTIIITHMMSATQQTIEFTNYVRAINRYHELCDMHNMEITEVLINAMYTAGGIGHDYRIELHVNN